MINIDDRLLKEVTPDEFWLLCHIAKHMGKDLSCFPSNATLSAATGWGIFKLNQVKRACIKKGFLRLEQRYNEKGQATNLYFIETSYLTVAVNLKGKGDTTPLLQMQHPPCLNSNTPPVANATTEVLTNEVLINNTAESEKDSAYTFEQFWNDYGYKKGSKAKAMSRFRKLTGRDIEALRAALPHYLRNTVTKDTGDRKAGFKPMRKYPEFFLSARVWESIADELNEKHEQTTIAAEQDPEYNRYMNWIKANYPNLLNAAKYMSRTEYQTFRTAYSGKRTIGANLEQTYMVRAHEDMEKDCTKLEQYNGVFALHLDRVQQFVKATTV